MPGGIDLSHPSVLHHSPARGVKEEHEQPVLPSAARSGPNEEFPAGYLNWKVFPSVVVILPPATAILKR